MLGKTRLIASAALLAGGLVAGVTVAGTQVGATAGFSFTRYSGGNNGLTPDRYGTAAAIAEAAFPSGATTAILATGDNFPDALAASFVAGQGTKSPILLTTTNNPIPSSTVAALQTLKVKSIIIMGGDAAVGPDVEASLGSLGYSTSRLQGPTRFDTMEQADIRPGDMVGQVGGVNTAIIATGDNFPDALGGGSLAFADHLPLVLTDGSAADLSQQAVDVLQNRAIKHAIVLGGPAAVQPSQIAELQTMGISVDTSATTGADRSATAALLATDEVDNLGFSNAVFGVADGFNPSSVSPPGFSPDALAGSPLGGEQKAPTLITSSPDDQGSTCSFVSPLSGSEATGLAYGGTSALTTATLAAIQTCAQGGGSGGSGARLYVPNLMNNSVTSYTASASGNATPATTIIGAATGLDGPNAAALSGGNLYIANMTGNSITIYPIAANGNVAPTTTISGAATGLNSPDGIGIGAAGRIWVANSGNNTITAYASSASGNAAPVVTISGGATGLAQPSDLWVNSSDAVAVTNFGNDSVTAYAAGANGNVAPVATITGSNTGLSGPSGLAIDAAGHLIVTNITAQTVTEYAAGANGNVAPTAQLSGANTLLSQPNGVAVTSTDVILVANFGNNSVTEYPFGTGGNVAPTTTISGAATGLAQPSPPAFG